MFTQKEKGELERQAVQVQKLDKIPITPEDKFAALKSTQAELAPVLLFCSIPCTAVPWEQQSRWNLTFQGLVVGLSSVWMQTVIESPPAVRLPSQGNAILLPENTYWPETQEGTRGLLQFRSFCIQSSQPHILFTETVMNWFFFFGATLKCPLFKCQHLVCKVLQAHSMELSQKNRRIVSVTFSCAVPCSQNVLFFKTNFNFGSLGYHL